MASIADAIFDAGLTTIPATGLRVDICVTEPATYAAATTIDANSLGNKTGLARTAPANGTIDGRKVQVAAITDGTVTGTGTQTAAFWAVTDGTSVLYATGALSAAQSVTNGNTFTLDAIDVTIRDAA